MRERRQLYEKFLQSVEILDLLDPYERDNIADALHSVVFEHNQRIIEEGTVGDCMYFVEVGKVRITKRDVRHFLTCSLSFSFSLLFCVLVLSRRRLRASSWLFSASCSVISRCVLVRACRTAPRRR